MKKRLIQSLAILLALGLGASYIWLQIEQNTKPPQPASTTPESTAVETSPPQGDLLFNSSKSLFVNPRVVIPVNQAPALLPSSKVGVVRNPFPSTLPLAHEPQPDTEPDAAEEPAKPPPSDTTQPWP